MSHEKWGTLGEAACVPTPGLPWVSPGLLAWEAVASCSGHLLISTLPFYSAVLTKGSPEHPGNQGAARDSFLRADLLPLRRLLPQQEQALP